MSDVFSYNLVFLLGRCCIEPELKEITDGKTLVKFSMATNELYSGGVKHVEFHPIVVFGEKDGIGKRGQFILDYLKKGMLLAVKGKLKHKSTSTQAGWKRTYTDVVADDVIILEWTKKEDKVKSKEAPF